MEADAGLSELLGVLRGTRERRSAILVSEIAAEHVRVPGAELVDARTIARRLQAGEPAALVAVEALSPTLLRALRESPPIILVVTGDADEETLESLARRPELALLGPHGILEIEDGDSDLLLCAVEAAGLADLRAAFAPSPVALALAPTPPWLITWIREPDAGLRAVGFVGGVRWRAVRCRRGR